MQRLWCVMVLKALWWRWCHWSWPGCGVQVSGSETAKLWFGHVLWRWDTWTKEVRDGPVWGRSSSWRTWRWFFFFTHKTLFRGHAMVQWLKLLPYSRKVSGSCSHWGDDFHGLPKSNYLALICSLHIHSHVLVDSVHVGHRLATVTTSSGPLQAEKYLFCTGVSWQYYITARSGPHPHVVGVGRGVEHTPPRPPTVGLLFRKENLTELITNEI